MDLHTQRESNKVGLNHYSYHFSNNFDYAVDKLIEAEKVELKNLYKRTDRYKIQQEALDDFIESQADSDEYFDYSKYYSLDEEIVNITDMQGISYQYDSLLSLLEMKIVYSYKTLENRVKRIAKICFDLKSVDDFYKWPAIESFFQDKNIDLKNIKGYNEVREIRIVNNNIKHADEYLSDLKKIKEFRWAKTLTYNEFETFYKRVASAPDDFFQSLCYAIYKELYTFDDAKINDLVDSFVLRMEKADALKFAQRLISNYENVESDENVD